MAPEQSWKLLHMLPVVMSPMTGPLKRNQLGAQMS